MYKSSPRRRRLRSRCGDAPVARSLSGATGTQPPGNTRAPATLELRERAPLGPRRLSPLSSRRARFPFRTASRLSSDLTHLPSRPPAAQNAPLLHKQYEAHKLGQKVPPPDSSCYRLDPPPEAQQNDPAAWQKAIDNAKAQLEHQVCIHPSLPPTPPLSLSLSSRRELARKGRARRGAASDAAIPSPPRGGAGPEDTEYGAAD